LMDGYHSQTKWLAIGAAATKVAGVIGHTRG
jgi:hypothetical protein